MQEILAYIALGFALGFLIKKYFFSSKKNSNCSDGCDCH
nr:FeoB-associated Cys-rich membrane protein [Lutibacter sp.]